MFPAVTRLQPDWFDIFERGPVPTAILAGASAAPAGELGRVDYANRAARQLLGDRRPVVDTSIFDVIDSTSHVELRHALAHSTNCDRSAQQILVQVEKCEGSRLFHLHLHSIDDGAQFVAQFVDVSTSGVEQVKVEQQRFRGALMELSEMAHSTEDDNEFYQRLLERAVEVVPGAQGGSVQLNIDGTAAFRFVAAVGYDLTGLQRYDLEQDHFFRNAWDPVAQIVRNFEAEARSPEISEWLQTVGRLSEIVVNVSAPVLSGGFPIAFLSLDNFEDPEAMTETSVEMTTVLSRLIGDLCQRRELEAQVRKEREAFRHLALHDPLTKLPNRRGLERSLGDMMAGCRQTGNPSAVLFVDVDDFKAVNDRLGHETGDLVLIGVADGLKASARASDVVGRWGGDEFLVLPHRVDSKEQMTSVGKRIIDHFATDLDLGGGSRYRARLSIGIGWSDDSALDMDQLIRRADRALYEAKSAGKGVVRIQTS